MSLVRVPEGDGWVSDLSLAPNKSLTPITLVVSPSIQQTRLSGSDSDQIRNCIERDRTDSGYRCSRVSLVRVSEGDGWVSGLYWLIWVF